MEIQDCNINIDKRQLSAFLKNPDLVPKDKASKIFKGNFGTQPIAVRVIKGSVKDRYDREAEVLRCTKKCKNIVTSIYHSEVAGFYIMMTPWYEANLFDFLNWKGDLPSTLQRKIVLEVAKGISDLHERGIVLCDLRPTKIFVIEDRGCTSIVLSNFRKCKTSLIKSVPKISSVWAPSEVKNDICWNVKPEVDSYSLALIAGLIWMDKDDRPLLLNDPGKFDVANYMLAKKRHLEHHLLEDLKGMKISVSQALRHPVFWEKRSIIRYVQMLQDKINEDESKHGVQDDIFKLKFKVSWKAKTDAELLKKMENPPNMKKVTYNDTATDFIKFLRNMIVHFGTITRARTLIGNKDEMGSWILNTYKDQFFEIFKQTLKHMDDFFHI